MSPSRLGQNTPNCKFFDLFSTRTSSPGSVCSGVASCALQATKSLGPRPDEECENKGRPCCAEDSTTKRLCSLFLNQSYKNLAWVVALAIETLIHFFHAYFESGFSSGPEMETYFWKQTEFRRTHFPTETQQESCVTK